MKSISETKIRRRVEQICSSLLSEGWLLVTLYQEKPNPIYQVTIFATFRHANGNHMAVHVEDNVIELWKNRRCVHRETVDVGSL